MKIPTSESDLATLFEKLGASNPEEWASSQINEGIPQLQRFLFLRQVWADVLPEGNTAWIARYISFSERSPNAPYAGLGKALARAVEKGISRDDLTEIARSMQAQLLSSICYRLDDPMFEEEELGDFSWGLFQMDDDGKPIPPNIAMLHESVLETDPTGREMRPRRAG